MNNAFDSWTLSQGQFHLSVKDTHLQRFLTRIFLCSTYVSQVHCKLHYISTNIINNDNQRYPFKRFIWVFIAHIWTTHALVGAILRFMYRSVRLNWLDHYLIKKCIKFLHGFVWFDKILVKLVLNGSKNVSCFFSFLFTGLLVLTTQTIASGHDSWEYPKARDNGVMPGKPIFFCSTT